jgi:ribonuclease VapC
MVIDTSVLVAVLFGEPEAEAFAAAIEQDPVRLISAASVLEASLVIESELGEAGGRELDLLLLKAAVETIPFNAEQLAIARHAYRRYGKGRHPVGLNYGDCFSYALSQATGETLLFKGEDFTRTDIAVWRSGP